MKKTKVLVFLLTLVLSASAVSLFAEGEKQRVTPMFGAIGSLVGGGPTLGVSYEYNILGNFSIGAKADLLGMFGFIIPVIPEVAAVLGYDFTDNLGINANLGWATWGAGITLNKVHNVNMNVNINIPSVFIIQLSYGYKFLF